jgi:hypothetical protein
MSLIPLYLCVRAMYLVDAFAPEMSAPVAMVHPQACSGGRRCAPCDGSDRRPLLPNRRHERPMNLGRFGSATVWSASPCSDSRTSPPLAVWGESREGATSCGRA